jgi:hypothetical protein
LQALKGLGAVAVAGLAALAFFYPARGSWAFAAADAVLIAFLWRRIRASDAAAPLSAAKQPLEPDEADLVRRYPYYFAHPEEARELASTLAAVGLLSLLLVPWLTYKAQWVQAVAIGACLFGVARLTKQLSPVQALKMAVAKGDREALRLLSAHDPAVRKVSNTPPGS